MFWKVLPKAKTKKKIDPIFHSQTLITQAFLFLMRFYDHLFFDLDNTLWDFNTNARQAMEITLQETGLIRLLPNFETFFSVYEPINHQLWDDYHQKKITKQQLIVERFSRSFKLFGLETYDWSNLNDEYLDHMGTQSVLFPKTLETLEYLKQKGYTMHIITNGFKEVQYKKLNNSGLNRFFTRVFVSEEIKTTKPHREIYEHALKSTNALKRKSIMIGNSWEIDIVGALQFGMDQVMFLNNEQNDIPEQIKSLKMGSNTSYLELKHTNRTFFINNIDELTTIL